MPARWKPVDSQYGKRGEFAEKLREVLLARGITAAEIAATAEVSRATVYAVLAGHRLPSVRLLEDILGLRPGAPRRTDTAVVSGLLKERDRLDRHQRRTARPPTPPVRVGVVPEHQVFVDALNEWVAKYRPQFPYYWPESDDGLGGWMPRGWLQRFMEGRAIPSEHGLSLLQPYEKPPKMPQDVWQTCIEEHDQLDRLAFEARRARRAAREVLRALGGPLK